MRFALFVLSAWVLATVTTSRAATEPSARLLIEARGFESSRGHAVLRLYRRGDNVLRDPPLSARVDIVNGIARFAVPLPPGEYAVVVLHDLNDNRKVDHGLLGLPKEPLGFSGGFELGVFSGKPTFEKLKFWLREGAPPMVIVVD